MEKHLFDFVDSSKYQLKTNPLICNLVFDSRKVKAGSLYFAWGGVHIHGNKFVVNAIENGASAVVYEEDAENPLAEEAKKLAEQKNIPLIKVENARFEMSSMAARFYDNPSSKMCVIGVTGTEGKSTTVFLIWQLLRLCGKKAGFISTVQYSLGDEAVDNPEHQTTPESTLIQEKLSLMVENGVEFAVVESSSHGLSERTNRLGDVVFDVGVMMNVTSEHLEFHGTYEQYKSDKANLFRNLDKFSHEKLINGKLVKVPAFGVVNGDDKAAMYFAECTKNPCYAFVKDENSKSIIGAKNYASNYFMTNIKTDEKGETFDIQKAGKMLEVFNDLRIDLPGTFNVYNATAAGIVVSNLISEDFESLRQQLNSLLPVKGRMTVIDCGQPFEVIVDYAHTPSSFETIFPPLKERLKLTTKGNLIVVFGSAGERDTKKRPEQGRIAAEYCDIVILADEDPRGEVPMTILEDIAIGCKNKTKEKDLFLIPDRKQAINKAFSIAKKGDIVLLLGKAHENSIIYKDFVMPYDEIEEAKTQIRIQK